ncbi:MAG: hypothetical protein II899_05485, partial [Bacteroidales bacterium]|nr:hypothetical protein [Bacteroidales bacterium]
GGVQPYGFRPWSSPFQSGYALLSGGTPIDSQRYNFFTPSVSTFLRATFWKIDFVYSETGLPAFPSTSFPVSRLYRIPS